LRRRISAGCKAVNQFINTPVQAGAGVAFRDAVALLYRHFRVTPTKLILSVHDSVVIECNIEDIEAVGREASQIMIDAVRKDYPTFLPASTSTAPLHIVGIRFA
jgi:DNA polymerase I-like protein with 3'-5' exonuclease and polymerase domains